MFEIKKNKSKVMICGTGSGWELIPQQTDSVIYALNDFIHLEKYGVKPDILFIMDVLDEKPQIVSGQDDLGKVIQRINALKVPFIAPYKYEEIPLSEAFPLEECIKEFGTPYFSNTIAYMIAYALLNGAKEIEFYGVNQAGSHEYAEEKSAVEYWIGVAVGRGIKVTINGKDSQLLMYKGRYGRGILYGYLQNWQEIQQMKQKFGEPIVRRLSVLPPQKSRTVRSVN